MKLVFVMPKINHGGGNRVFIEIINRLLDMGKNVEILIPYNTKNINYVYNLYQDVKIIKVGKLAENKIGKIINLIKLKKYIKNYLQEDFIIFSDPIISIFLATIKNKNLYRFLQADDYKIFDDKYLIKSNFILALYKEFTRQSYKKRINFIFNSEYVFHSFVKIAKREVKKNIVCPGYNEKIFYDKNQRSMSDVLTIATVGRKHPWKGLNDFLELVDMCGTFDGKVKYLVITNENINIENKFVTVKEPKDDNELSELYNSADIFISNSWWEGFGLPQLESMACGCAGLFSDSGGISEFCNNKNCILYKPKDVLDLKDKLLLLVKDMELIRRLSLNGRKVEEKFTWTNTVESFLKVINEREGE